MRLFLVIFSIVIFCFFLFTNNIYGQFTKLVDLTSTWEANPKGDFISDGTYLYGMTEYGGTNNKGVVFKIMPDGTGYVKLLDFIGVANGANPYGSLFFDGTFLYGMTQYGGTNNNGVIFKIKPDGTTYVKLLDFDGTNGKWPRSTLISDGTFLYGMTYIGGLNNNGAIFKIMPDGTGYSKLFDFNVINGEWSCGSLISDGVYLYGMTEHGGTSGNGVVFKIKTDGTDYTKILDFNGIVNGANPCGSLIFDGSYLYGMTEYGGSSDKGVIFKIKPDGTDYAKLLDFNGVVNGANPIGTLISNGTFLYGMTSHGGLSNNCSGGCGTLFSIMSDGTGYVKLLNFAADTIGSEPYGSLFSDGTFFYGMTSYGGLNSIGIIFKITPNGTGFSKLYDFAGAANGSEPCGSLISDGTFIYGTTISGGTSHNCTSGCGMIFKLKNDYTDYIRLYNFTGISNGRFLQCSLFSDSIYLYGMTTLGGTNDDGVIYRIKSDGSDYVKLFEFSGTANGSYPIGSLIFDGTFFYGTTHYGGSVNEGVLFKIKSDGTNYVKLLDFIGISNGTQPRDALYFDGIYLYGITAFGGTNDKGVLYKIKPDGSGYVKLLDFNGVSNGANPIGSLIFYDTFLYGITNSGGSNNKGVIYKIHKDGTGFVKLHEFIGVTNGANPIGPLFFDNTFFYGTTYYGGTSGNGTLFKIRPDGTGFSKLFDFNGLNGSQPLGTLLSFEGFLYGTTILGGISNYGTIFKFCSFEIDTITTTNVSCYNGNDGTATANVSGGLQPYTFFWNTTPSQTTQTATGLSAGTYLVTVTDLNSFSEVKSATITQPSVFSITSTGTNATCYNNEGSAIVIASGGTPPYAYLWSNNNQTQTLTGIGSGIFSITVTDNEGCTIIDSVTIDNSISLQAPSICIVGVDSTSTRNIIAWEKPLNAPIASFNIFREISSVNTQIATVPYTAMSVFIDTINGVNPNLASYKYSISILDTCGNESPMSIEHRTIHLDLIPAIPCGYTLFWNDYLGFPITQYLIYKDSSNTGWTKIDSVGFGNNEWTDSTCYYINDSIAYRVVAVKSLVCNISNFVEFDTTYSNLQMDYLTMNPLQLSDNLSLKISPNPTNGKFQISLKESGISISKIEILNVFGENIYQLYLPDYQFPITIDLSNHPSGIYFVRIVYNNSSFVRKILKY